MTIENPKTAKQLKDLLRRTQSPYPSAFDQALEQLLAFVPDDVGESNPLVSTLEASPFLPIVPENLADLASLVGHYTGNNTYEDSSGNEHHLVENGAVSFMPIHGTDLMAFFFNGIGELILANAGHNSSFAFLGDYTVGGYICPFLEGAAYIASYDSPTDGSSDDNDLWSVQRGSPNSVFNRGSLIGGWEHGTQSVVQFNNNLKPAFHPTELAFFVWRRRWTGSVWEQTGYINGYQVIQSGNTNANTPTGGANSKLRIGSNGKSLSRLRGALADLFFFNVAVEEAKIFAEAQRIGVRP